MASARTLKPPFATGYLGAFDVRRIAPRLTGCKPHEIKRKSTRDKGTNPRALGTNPRAQRRVLSKAKRMGWKPNVAPADQLPSWLRFEVLKRDGFRCSYCGSTPRAGAVLHVDHVKPKAAGGTDDPSNLTTSCKDCNIGKAARKLNEAAL